MPDDPELEAEETAAAEEKETHDGFIDLESHQKDVNVQHKRFRDEERGRVKEQARADGLQKEVDDLKGANAEVVVPPVPDKYSDTFDADMKTRDEALVLQAEQTAATDTAAAKRKENDEVRATEESTAVNERVATFDSNMVTHGLKPEVVKAAVDTLIENGISVSFQDMLLEDKDGPLMVQYLAVNPVETEKINGMSPLSMVNHLNGEIRAKALLLKPQTSAAPDPPIVLDGGGAPETKEDWEAGAVYE